MDIKPDVKVFVTIAGTRWQMIDTGKLTFPEAREAKRVSGGMSLTELERGIQNGDPDAWFAWIFVSIKRSWAAVTEAELEKSIGDTPLVAIIGSAESEAPEVATDPPASPGASAEPAPGSDESSSS